MTVKFLKNIFVVVVVPLNRTNYVLIVMNLNCLNYAVVAVVEDTVVLNAKLKIGTKGIKIADPKGLRDTREWYDRNWPPGAPPFGSQGVGSACIGCGQVRKSCSIATT